jgi:hypothetical protein
VVSTVASHLQISDLKRFEVGENSSSRTMCIAIVACLASLMARSGLGDPRLGRDIPNLDPKLHPIATQTHRAKHRASRSLQSTPV